MSAVSIIPRKGAFSALLIWLALQSSIAGAETLVAFLDGTAACRVSDNSTWKNLSIGDKVSEHCYIRTGPDSSLELLSEGRYRLLFAANTLAVLKADKANTVNYIQMHTGQLMSDIFSKGQSLQVRTSQVAMGVRGTQFTVLANLSDRTDVAVKEGKVFELRRQNGTAEGVLINAGEKSICQPGANLAINRLTPSEETFYDFPAFGSMGTRTTPLLYDHYVTNDPLFQKFQQKDLDDFQLFVLKDTEDQWNAWLKDHEAYDRLLYSLRQTGD
jgi:hypothetical protein